MDIDPAIRQFCTEHNNHVTNLLALFQTQADLADLEPGRTTAQARLRLEAQARNQYSKAGQSLKVVVPTIAPAAKAVAALPPHAISDQQWTAFFIKRGLSPASASWLVAKYHAIGADDLQKNGLLIADAYGALGPADIDAVNALRAPNPYAKDMWGEGPTWDSCGMAIAGAVGAFGIAGVFCGIAVEDLDVVHCAIALGELWDAGQQAYNSDCSDWFNTPADVLSTDWLNTGGAG